MLKKNQEFVNAPFSRRKQLMDWLVQEIGRSGSTYLIDQIRQLLRSGDPDNINQAVQLTKYMLFKAHSDETLKYIIQKNVDKYGLELVIESVMQILFTTPVRLSQIDRGLKKQSKENLKDIKQVKRQVRTIRKTQPKEVFGFNKQGQKRVAELDIIFVRGQSVVRLRDSKTGRFLKNPREVS